MHGCELSRGALLAVLLVAAPLALADVHESRPGPEPARLESSAAPSGADLAWETLTPMPEGRALHAVAADPLGRIYSFGGTSDAEGELATSSVFRYDPMTSEWQILPSMPRPLFAATAVAIADRIYLPGDSSGAETLVFDPIAGVWSSIAPNSGYSARSQYRAVARGVQLFVLGGVVAASGLASDEVWVLDTSSQTWSLATPMNTPRISFSAGLVGDDIVVSGGVGFPGFEPVMSTEILDGSSWRFAQPVPDGGGAFTRWSYNASLSDGARLWLAGGRRDAAWSQLAQTGFYEPATGLWQTTPDLPALDQPRVYLEGALGSDGYFHVLGGRNATATQIYSAHERLRIAGPARFDVGGPIIGLLGSGLIVSEAVSGQTIQLQASAGSYRFVLDDGSPYLIDVISQPTDPIQSCALESPSGQVNGASVLDLFVICQTEQFEVGGSVSNLIGAGLVLREQLQGLTQSVAPGAESYAFLLDDGSSFNIIIDSQPAGQFCQLANAIGVVDGAGVASVEMACFPVGIVFSPINLDLGPVALGEAGIGAITVTNPGAVDLTLFSVSQIPAPFVLTGGSCFPLARTLTSGQSCEIEFSLLGEQRGSYQITVAVTSTAISSPSELVVRGVVTGEALLVPISSSMMLTTLLLLMLLGGVVHLRQSRP